MPATETPNKNSPSRRVGCIKETTNMDKKKKPFDVTASSVSCIDLDFIDVFINMVIHCEAV